MIVVHFCQFLVLFYIQSHPSPLFFNALNKYLSEIVHIVQKCWSMIIEDVFLPCFWSPRSKSYGLETPAARLHIKETCFMFDKHVLVMEENLFTQMFTIHFQLLEIYCNDLIMEWMLLSKVIHSIVFRLGNSQDTFLFGVITSQTRDRISAKSFGTRLWTQLKWDFFL